VIAPSQSGKYERYAGDVGYSKVRDFQENLREKRGASRRPSDDDGFIVHQGDALSLVWDAELTRVQASECEIRPAALQPSEDEEDGWESGEETEEEGYTSGDWD
tara:strand:+ start:115 stop:426 length:312 start_codon:yes stop_codon:yes gene_type:complete